MYSQFKKQCNGKGKESEDEAPAKKRKRANSNVSASSNGSSVAAKKRSKKAESKTAHKKGSAMATRRKSSELEWTPNPDHAVKTGHIKEYNFSRIKEEKLVGLAETKIDNRFDAVPDSYGGWSNTMLDDKVGKDFTK